MVFYGTVCFIEFNYMFKYFPKNICTTTSKINDLKNFTENVFLFCFNKVTYFWAPEMNQIIWKLSSQLNLGNKVG